MLLMLLAVFFIKSYFCYFCNLFLRDHLFVTKRVAVRVGNFLIGAPFVSDRPRHLFFRPNKSVLGPLDVFGPFSTFLANFSEFLIFETVKSLNIVPT